MTWNEIIKPILSSPEMVEFKEWLIERRKTTKVYPSSSDIFAFTKVVPFDNIKMVILNDEPYGDENDHGLALSSKKNFTPSLKALYKELHSNLYYHLDFNEFKKLAKPDLTHWSQEGVLLLNRILTKEADGKSHTDKGWESLTEHIIHQVNGKSDPIAFILLGTKNQDFLPVSIRHKRHAYIECPGLLDDKFAGCECFKKAINHIGPHYDRRVYDVSFDEFIDFKGMNDKYRKELEILKCPDEYNMPKLNKWVTDIKKFSKAMQQRLTIYRTINFLKEDLNDKLGNNEKTAS